MNNKLVQMLIDNKTLYSESVISACSSGDRADFIPEESRPSAPFDHPIHIGHRQTISQPTTVAFMLELLNAKTGDKVLDIGSGSGWTTALLGHIVGHEGKVLGLERVEELVEFGRNNIKKYNMEHVQIEKAGTALGRPRENDFDKILVSAAARAFPESLLSQVKEEGVIVLPVRDSIWKVVRFEHQPIIEKFEGYIFVPLIEN
jgi:protein-L-isoaspartate(D-aspartate) O-methyltransferase